MDTGITQEYMAAIQDEIKLHLTPVINGNCKDFEGYKFKIGYIQGLQKAEILLHDVIREALAAQDVDD